MNPLRSSVRNVSNIVRSMPDNFVDGVTRVSGGFRNIPNNMLDGVGKMLNVKGVSISYASDLFSDFYRGIILFRSAVASCDM